MVGNGGAAQRAVRQRKGHAANGVISHLMPIDDAQRVGVGLAVEGDAKNGLAGLQIRCFSRRDLEGMVQGGNPINADTAPLNLLDTDVTGQIVSQEIGEEGIDLALLPIGDNFTMGPDDALRAVKMLQPKVVIPIHYNTWGLIAQDPNAWAERVQKETNTKVVVLKPGESYSV